jgi:hypothetical protein
VYSMDKLDKNFFSAIINVYVKSVRQTTSGEI